MPALCTSLLEELDRRERAARSPTPPQHPHQPFTGLRQWMRNLETMQRAHASPPVSSPEPARVWPGAASRGAKPPISSDPPPLITTPSALLHPLTGGGLYLFWTVLLILAATRGHLFSRLFSRLFCRTSRHSRNLKANLKPNLKNPKGNFKHTQVSPRLMSSPEQIGALQPPPTCMSPSSPGAVVKGLPVPNSPSIKCVAHAREVAHTTTSTPASPSQWPADDDDAVGGANGDVSIERPSSGSTDVYDGSNSPLPSHRPSQQPSQQPSLPHELELPPSLPLRTTSFAPSTSAIDLAVASADAAAAALAETCLVETTARLSATDKAHAAKMRAIKSELAAAQAAASAEAYTEPVDRQTLADAGASEAAAAVGAHNLAHVLASVEASVEERISTCTREKLREVAAIQAEAERRQGLAKQQHAEEMLLLVGELGTLEQAAADKIGELTRAVDAAIAATHASHSERISAAVAAACETMAQRHVQEIAETKTKHAHELLRARESAAGAEECETAVSKEERDERRGELAEESEKTRALRRQLQLTLREARQPCTR